ncbi:MAG: TerB family tellurite resistance protein [Prevotella sp.]|nr:TerB family tellurite resistance protein [Prevotella sp.]
MSETKEPITWNRILGVVLSMPGVKVDREAFLRKELKPYCSAAKLNMLGSVRPYNIVSDGIVDKVANSCIKRHTALVTTASTIAGLPGGLAMAATIPGDITQYYYHVIVLSQKLAYLYGFPDFCEEDGELSEGASDLLTIFMGSMMGAKVADQGISELAKEVAKEAVGRLQRIAITKSAVYPIAVKVAQLVGVKLTKEGMAKTVGKLIPIAGGLFSGSLTLFSFNPGAKRLQKRLKAQKHHFVDGDVDALEFDNIKSSFVKAERSESHPEDKQRAVVEAMINIANINGSVSAEKYKLIEQCVAQSDLSDDAKLELLGHVATEQDRVSDFSYDVDYELLACDVDFAQQAVRAMIDVIRADGHVPTMAERMYLTMTAKAIGIDKDTLNDMLEAAISGN